MKISTFAAACALALTAFGAQATIINIDATNQGEFVVETFAAGTYDVRWIGASNGGLYDAWGAAVNSQGDMGHAKYRNAFGVSFNGGEVELFGDYGPYNPDSASSALAYAQANPTTFTFATETTGVFIIPDNAGQYWDNNGGVSLSITAAVPEPETYAMMAAGLAALAFMSRRRKAV